MTCLHCQKQFEIHSGKELIVCITWIQDKHYIRSEQLRKTESKLEKIKNIYEQGIIYVKNFDGTNTNERLGYSHVDHHKLEKILNEDSENK